MAFAGHKTVRYRDQRLHDKPFEIQPVPRALAVPLALGNTVILKSSELCPETHRLIGQCLNDAGIPKGAVNVISNAPEDAAEIVEALISAPQVRHVNFTGSSKVGRIIGRLAGEHLKPCLLELGGKAPFVVLDDADIDGAVNAAIFGCYMNQGQICMSTERMIVDASIADEFSRKFSERASALIAGDPRDDVVLGALCQPDAGERMEDLIADAVQRGDPRRKTYDDLSGGDAVCGNRLAAAGPSGAHSRYFALAAKHHELGPALQNYPDFLIRLQTSSDSGPVPPAFRGALLTSQSVWPNHFEVCPAGHSQKGAGGVTFETNQKMENRHENPPDPKRYVDRDIRR